MKRIAVESSCIKFVAYSAARSVLQIEFTSGVVGEYSNVPASVYEALVVAESKGRYYTAHIRNNYPYRQLRGKPADSVLHDLSAIAEYLREQNGGQIPHAQELVLAS